jgi:hypothetical protein
MAPRKKRSGANPAPDPNVIESDTELDSIESLNRHFLGTVIISVDLLNENWDNNRELNMQHVKELQESFKADIRRWYPETRLRASTSMKVWENFLKNCLHRFAKEKDPTKHTWSPGDNDGQPKLEGWTLESLKQFALKNTGHFSPPQLSASTHLWILEPDVLCENFVLDAGQHRKHALIAHCNEKYKTKDRMPVDVSGNSNHC